MKYFVIAIMLTIFSTFTVVAQNKWPKEMKLADGSSLTIYQPQPESLNGNKITGRAAVSVKKNTGGEPIFGAIFYAGTITTDKASRMAELETLHISNVKFSGDAEKDKIDKMAAAIEKEAPTWNIQFSIDDVVASIKKDNTTSSNNQFNNDPPKIIYTDKPTTLVLLDGAPKVQQDKDLDAERVVSTVAVADLT